MLKIVGWDQEFKCALHGETRYAYKVHTAQVMNTVTTARTDSGRWCLKSSEENSVQLHVCVTSQRFSVIHTLDCIPQLYPQIKPFIWILKNYPWNTSYM